MAPLWSYWTPLSSREDHTARQHWVDRHAPYSPVPVLNSSPPLDSTAVRGGGLWQDLEEEALQRSKVDREAARRALLDERNERQKEDRSGGRAWEACKRARQESVHLLSSPSGFRPMPTVGLATRPKRRPPGGPRGGPSRVVPSSPVEQSDGRGYGSVCWSFVIGSCACGVPWRRRSAAR